MKVLLCHNYYRFRGGEDVSFENDVQMLRDYGHEVVTYTRDNVDLVDMSGLRAAKIAFWNHETEQEVREIIRRERPDVMHCNNLFPLISPSIYRPANEAGIPVVQALRNYRLLCSGATFYRNGKVCTDCFHKTIAYPAIVHKCYRNSSSASAVVAAMHAYHRSIGTWDRRVDAFFTPSEFARQLMAKSILEAQKVHTKLNFVFPDRGPGSGAGKFALYVGRISREKGIETLAEAWTKYKPHLPLKVVGQGESKHLRSALLESGRVEMLGWQSQEEVLELMAEATCLILPSRWYETFGRTMAEALSRGTPVVASNLGAMAELVRHEETGFLFPPGDAAALAQSVNRIAEDTPGTQCMRERARRDFLARFTRDRSYRQLQTIYSAALAGRGSRESVRLQVDQA